MDLLLIGYGKMNRLVAEVAAAEGHRVVKTVDNEADWKGALAWSPQLVAIDFSVAEAVLPNLARCLEAGIPMVIGTTGWYDRMAAARALAEASSVGAVYGANFSIGVQALYRAAAAAARSLPAGAGGYEAFIWEAHHSGKRDAPSGTALRLAQASGEAGHPAAIASSRAGAQPGTHTIGFDGSDDTLTITHTARSRRGFAAGALRAARWLPGRRGWHEFGAVMAGLEAEEATGEGS